MTADPLSPEAADVLLKWLVAGVAKSAPTDPATQEAIQYVITGRAERRLAGITTDPLAPTPPDALDVERLVEAAREVLRQFGPDNLDLLSNSKCGSNLVAALAPKEPA